MADQNLKDWEVRQFRTFSKWINMYLAKKGYEDRCEEGEKFGSSFSNGILLMKLVNALYDTSMPKRYQKDPTTRVKCQDNVTRARQMLEKAEVQTYNLTTDAILDGNAKMMAGLTWAVILDYNIKGISVEDSTAKQGLLIWCRKKTKGYKGVDGDINNFSKDWANGNAFLALVDRHTTGLVDYDEMYDKSAEEKLDKAFTVCEGLGIMRLLEVEDLTTVAKPDEKAVMTYVSELFKLFSKEDIKENAAQHLAKFLKFERKMEGLGADYEARFKEIKEWFDSRCNHFGSADEPADQMTSSQMLEEYKTYIMEEKPAKMVDVVEIQDLYANIQGELRVNGRATYTPPEDMNPEELATMRHNLQGAEEEYCEMIRKARLQFIDKMDDGGSISDERKAEFEKSFDVFDADSSGRMNKMEFKAALSAIGIALSEEDCDKVFAELSGTAEDIDKDTYMNYVVQFFSTSDDEASIMKSLQTLGDPNNITKEMLSQPPLTDEDTEYLMSKAEDGSLAAFISSSFASSD